MSYQVAQGGEIASEHVEEHSADVQRSHSCPSAWKGDVTPAHWVQWENGRGRGRGGSGMSQWGNLLNANICKIQVGAKCPFLGSEDFYNLNCLNF